jgi:hypothetical protein
LRFPPMTFNFGNDGVLRVGVGENRESYEPHALGHVKETVPRSLTVAPSGDIGRGRIWLTRQDLRV